METFKKRGIQLALMAFLGSYKYNTATDQHNTEDIEQPDA